MPSSVAKRYAREEVLYGSLTERVLACNKNFGCLALKSIIKSIANLAVSYKMFLISLLMIKGNVSVNLSILIFQWFPVNNLVANVEAPTNYSQSQK